MLIGPAIRTLTLSGTLFLNSDSSVKSTGKDEYEVDGKLTLHGVTKDLKLKVLQVGMAESDKGKAAGYETHATIKRSDYGMTGYIDNGMLGDDVDVIVSVEAHAD